MKNKILFTVLALALSYQFTAAQKDIYLAPDGNDRNTGSIEKPLASVGAALKIIQQIHGTEAINVLFRSGYYPLTGTIIIDSSLTGGHPLNISNYKNEVVVISGGIALDSRKFKPVSDPSILKRLPEAARSKVVETDLQGQGVSEFGKRVPHGFARETTAPLELFSNNDPLQLARWPNSGTLPINKVLDHGSMPRSGGKDNRGAKFTYDFTRPSSWVNKDDIWLYGVFAHNYADDNVEVDSIDENAKTIKTRQASYYGVYGNDENKEGNGQSPRGYYFYNILEELDTAGEWYMDSKSHKLYVWPTTPVSSARFTVSMLEAPLLVLYHLKNINIKGLEFGFGRGLGIYAAGCTGIEINHCRFFNFGTKAISTSDPISPFTIDYKSKWPNPDQSPNSKFTIRYCTIFNCGTGAITINGGNRKTLVSGENEVSNCDIYNYSRINRASPPAIILGGVGNKVSHCYIHDASAAAIGYNGNNHEISYNHITQVATDFSDIGAVYTGRDPSSTGNKILYNFFDSIQSHREYAVAAVYIDDGSGGMIVNGNVFYKCGSTRGYGAVHINGGSDNQFDGNYYIECPKAFSNTVWDDKKWRTNMYKPDMVKRLTKDVDIRSPDYLSRYPYLKTFFDSISAPAPRVNYIANSLVYQVPLLTTGKTTFNIENTFNSADGSEFIDEKRKNFNLKSIPPSLKQSSNWKAIPFGQIGIQP